jgi:predicted ATPase
MQSALSRHDSILREHIKRNQGYVFKTVGDAFCAAFETAPDAVAAALDAQSALLTEPWGVPGGIRVRVALHTGTCEERDGDYFGQTLNRVARLLSIGHGGQILVSLVASELVRDLLPEDVRLKDLGAHRLKDLMRPESVFQLAKPGLPSDFPPLKSLDNHPNNLPIQPNPFIGREKELEAVRGLLRDEGVRVLTLTGTGGTGKTRLSLQAAADLVDRFPDGVFFVDLSAIDTPAYVIVAIARTLGIRETGAQPLRDLVSDALRDKDMLLLLDNFEQVMAAAPRVVELLSSCPRLKLLVTSREALRIRAERVFRVPPLEAPKMREIRDLSLPRLRQYEAVALFIERAVAARNDFIVNNENAPAVAEICARLDGLPLAIELAAARADLLSPQAILQRLGGSLKLLASGATDLPYRQRTLRATIDWSYRLLIPAEQMLFRQMAVFSGGCTLEAAEAVCACGGPEGPDVLQVLSSLVAKSLLWREEKPGGAQRFILFESIREYGLLLLQGGGGDAPFRDAHAKFYREKAESLVPSQNGPAQKDAFDALEEEQENLAAALDWLDNRGRIEEELSLCGALRLYWQVRGPLRDGRRICLRALKRGADASACARAGALLCAGVLARLAGEYAQAMESLEKAVSEFRAAADCEGVGQSLYELGMALFRHGDSERAANRFLDVLEAVTGVSAQTKASARMGLGLVEEKKGRLDSAFAHFEASRDAFGALGNERLLAYALGNLGNIHYVRGDVRRALELSYECLALNKNVGDEMDLALNYNNAGFFHSILGEHREAQECYRALGLLAARSGNSRLQSLACSGLADAALGLGDNIEALEYAKKAYDIASRLGEGMELGVSLRILGEVTLALKEPVEAEKYFARSIPLLEKYIEQVDMTDLVKARKGCELARSRRIMASREPLARTSFSDVPGRGEEK